MESEGHLHGSGGLADDTLTRALTSTFGVDGGSGSIGGSTAANRFTVGTMTAALILYTTIVGLAYVSWLLVAPYIHGVAVAIILSLVLHSSSAHKLSPEHVERRLVLSATQWDTLLPWWLRGWLSRTLATRQIFRATSKRFAEFWGIHKLPLLRYFHKEYAWLAVAPLALWAMGGWWAILTSGIAATIIIVLSLFVNVKRQARWGPAFLTVVHVGLLILCLSYDFGLEMLDAQNDVRLVVGHIQQYGVDLPPETADSAVAFVTSYVLPANASLAVLKRLPLLLGNMSAALRAGLPPSVFPSWFSSTTSDSPHHYSNHQHLGGGGGSSGFTPAPEHHTPLPVFEEATSAVSSPLTEAEDCANTVCWSQIAADVKTHLATHLDPQDVELIVLLAKSGGQVLVAALNVLTNLLLLLFAWGYEFALCGLLLSHLLHRERTILFAVMEKGFALAHTPKVATKRANDFEQKFTKELQSLLMFYVHLIAYHFFSCMILFRLFGVSYPTVTGLVAVVVAIVPVGLPKILTPCLPAIIWAFARGTYARGASLLVAAFILGNDAFLLENQAGGIGGFEMGTAIILGFTVFGIRGVFVGPLVFLVVRAMWSADVTSSSSASPGGHDTGSPSDSKPLDLETKARPGVDRRKKAD